MDGAIGKAPLGGEKPAPARQGTRSVNPTDRAKRGVKRSLLTDGRGMPLFIVAAGANTNDHKLMRETIEEITIERPAPSAAARRHLCLDKGYDYDAPSPASSASCCTRGEETEAKRRAGTKARRWVVERTHSWMNRFRRILVRWEKKSANDLAMLHFALGLITWRNALPR